MKLPNVPGYGNPHINEIKEELKKLPDSPGVYIMHNEKDEIIYVGKAIVLKNRVRQYFQSGHNHTMKIKRMVSQVAYFEYIMTDSETEALVLECNLIKEHRPKYNTMLKDDKGYPYIKVTVNEDYPRIVLARQMKRDKAKYFGPYTSSTAVKDVIELVCKLYQIRTCSKVISKDHPQERACLYYHMEQCKAPCLGGVSKEEYSHQVEKVLSFLNGDYKEVLNTLKLRMNQYASDLEFEQAAKMRDLMNSVYKLEEKQKINQCAATDKDVVAIARREEEVVVSIFFVRNGKILGREHFHMMHSADDDDVVVMTAFVKQFYSGTPYLPGELLLECEVEEMEAIENWLSAKRGAKVKFTIPQKGDKHKLIELAKKNAYVVLKEDLDKIKREELRTTGAVKEIADLIGQREIRRMEAFDISNISGFQTVASMIVFEDGKPKRSDYRKFKIRSVEGPDDYKSMEEVLTRRFLHGLKEQKERKIKNIDDGYGNFSKLPDIIMMDGGKGQVNVACRVLEQLHLSIPVCGMVKDDHHRTRGLYYENKEFMMDTHSEGFKLITRMQDEAHRFAITFHRSLRSKNQVHSILDEIYGVGPTRRKALMKHFKDIDKIKEASIEELMETEGMTMNVAESIYQFFRKKKS